MQIPLTSYLIIFAMGISRNQSSQTAAPESPSTLPEHDPGISHGVEKDETYVRYFDSARDQNQLEMICRHVFQGNDYLPRLAKKLENDEMSQFYVLARQKRVGDRNNDIVDEHQLQDEVMLACANLRTLSDQDSWLEAVRTAPEYRNQGYARKLLETILYHLHPQRNLYTCTVASNTPMIRVFEKLQMQFVSNIHLLEWSILLRIPGWKSTDTTASNPLNLLQGLGLSPSQFQDDNNEKSFHWQSVSTITEVEQALESIRSQGGSGWIPALFEILSVRSPALQEALQNQMIWRRRRQRPTPRQPLPQQFDDHDCLIAFVRDPRIQSLRSPWVLCISGTKEEHVRSAVEYGCHSDMQRQLLTLQHRHGSDNNAVAQEGENAVGFALAVDGTISKEGEFMKCLPWGKDPCVVYTKTDNEV
jgi:GNAT superfamily N-acetyltransferase